MAEENEINYDDLIKEVDGINPTSQDTEEQELSAARMVELQKELSEVAYGDRNDDYTLVWNGLHEKANAMITELANRLMDDISAEQLSAFKSLLENFTSHTTDGYDGIAAELKSKLDNREEILNAQAATEELQENAPFSQEGNEVSENEPVMTEDAQEENDDMSDTEGVELDSEQKSFLESITEENKEQIADRFNKIDQAAEELEDIFAVPQDENSEDLFKGLRNFYDNVWVDRDIPDDENAQPGEDDLKKREQLKERMKEMATIMAIQDLVQDESVDAMSQEQIKERMREAVRDNMTFLTYNLVANQSGFKILEGMPDVTKMSPQQRQEHIASLQDGYKDVFNGVNDILSGQSKVAISVSSPAIVATVLPQYKESQQFAKEFKEKTGVKKLWNRVKNFDAKMTKDHPQLWGIAKTVAVSSLTGPVGMMAYTGHSIYKQSKGLWNEYKQQQSEKGDEALSFGKFLGQNKGKLASIAISAGFAAYSGVGSLNFGDLAQSLANNSGILGNMTGSLLSGDALNNVSQNLSWDNLKNAAGNMVDKISGIGNVDASQVLDTIKQSYNPTRLLRVGLSSLGVGIAKAHDAYSTASDDNKWKAARKAFTAHLTASLTGLAIADAMTATGDVMHQTSIELKDIEAREQEFMKGLNDFENGNIPVQGLGLGENTIHIGDPNSGVHIGMEAEKLSDINIPKAPSAEAVHNYNPPSAPHTETPAQQNETPATETKPVQEEVEHKFVELEVNGEKMEVDVKDGMTTEEIMDKARAEYLKNHPEIPVENNKVEITQGADFKSSIETQKEDIMKGEAVIGQETTTHRELPDAEDGIIKDDINEIKTDTGQAKLMESEGRMDGDTNNIIPDGAKILKVAEFHNEHQDFEITEFEHNGERYYTDGQQIKPATQNLDDMYKGWNTLLRDTAAEGYDENGTPIVQETQQTQTQGEHDNTVKGEETVAQVSTGDHYDTLDGMPPVYTGNDSNVNIVPNSSNAETPKEQTVQSDKIIIDNNYVAYEGFIDPNASHMSDFGNIVNMQSVTNAPSVDLGFGEKVTPFRETQYENGVRQEFWADERGSLATIVRFIDKDGNYEVFDSKGNSLEVKGNIHDDKINIQFTKDGAVITDKAPELAAVENKELSDAEKIAMLRQGKAINTASSSDNLLAKNNEHTGAPKSPNNNDLVARLSGRTGPESHNSGSVHKTTLSPNFINNTRDIT